VISKHALGTPIISPAESYSLGASFGVVELEERYRTHIIADFEEFLKLDECLSRMEKWCPRKFTQLVKDVWTEEVREMDALLGHCRTVYGPRHDYLLILF